jgi:hypothetical protein
VYIEGLFARHDATRSQIVLEGAVQPLVLLCTWNKDALVLGNAAGALANLAADQKLFAAVLRDGAVSALSSSLSSSLSSCVSVPEFCFADLCMFGFCVS